MSLFSFLHKKTTKQEKKYFGIYLTQNNCILAVLSDNGTHIELQEQYHVPLSEGWTKLAEDLDQQISMLDQQVASIEQVIFFIPSAAIDQENKKLKSPFLEHIKTTVKKLGLKPLGFIGADEAVIASLYKKEAVPPSALLVELTAQEISVFIYKAGSSSFSKIIARSEDIFADFQQILEEIKGTMMLPARIIAYGDTDLELFYQRVLHYKWSEEIFIQIPRVEIFAEKDLLQAFTEVFSQQIHVDPQAVVETSTQNVPLDSKEDEPVPESTPELMGFHIGVDEQSPVVQEEQAVVADAEVIEVKTHTKKAFPLAAFFSKFKTIFTMVPKKRIVIPVFIVLICLGLIIVQEVFFHKAAITVFFPSRQIHNKYDVSLSLADSSGPLQIHIATQSAEFTETKNVSGKKDIGERAKGKVTIHNFDEKEKIFNRGIVLSTGNIKFTLDEDVKVASASIASDGSAKLPGKSQGNITASAIGTESNFDKGQRFAFEGLSSSVYFAINDGGSLSGGTKKTVAVVSQQDVTQLRNSILKKAQSGQSNRPPELQPSDKLITDLTEVSIEKSTPSEAVGDEADKLTLKANVVTTYYYLQDNEVKGYLASNMQTEVSGDFQLDREKILYSFDSVKKAADEESIDMVLDGSAKATMITDKEAIEKVLSGKSKQTLDTVLRGSFKATGYEIDNKVLIPIPVLQNYTPFIQKNIILNISYL